MKKIDAIIFYLAVGLFLIAIHQAMTIGIQNAYGIFMFSISLLFLYLYRKGKKKRNDIDVNGGAKD